MARKARDYKAEYAKRLARGQAQGKTRQQARGHKAHEHIERKEREREEHGGLTLDQVRSVHKWGSERERIQPRNIGLNPDDLVAWAQDHGFDEYRKFRRAWERQRKAYKKNPRPKGERQLGDLWDDIDTEDLGIEWLYYH